MASPPAAVEIELRCDLCIIGAGYAGVCAYNAAVKYLRPGARVVVIDPRGAWGGQWIDQYDYVRLHQPYSIFTAGERAWSTTKPAHHLATKTEILAHLEDVSKLATAESGVDLVELFGFRYNGHTSDGSGVDLDAECCVTGEGPQVPRVVHIRADRLIKALGLNIQIKKPLPVTSPGVYSLSPGDVQSPHWKAAMRFSDKPIYVVGSGKTGLDCINHLHGSGEAFSSRLGCIAGRGMWYIVRDVGFPTGFAERMFTEHTILDYFFQMFQLHDGQNEREVYREMGRRGFFHSAVPDAQNFALGISSRAEVASAKLAMGDRVLKAHLLDVVEVGGGESVMRLRALDGTIFDKPIPQGSFIINATDHYTEDNINSFEPLLSDDGLVLSPQTALAFTGPGCDLLVHAWYLGLMKNFWTKMIRSEGDSVNKHKGGMSMLYVLVFNTILVMTQLPFSIGRSRKSNPGALIPFHRRIGNAVKFFNTGKVLYRKALVMEPYRWTDKKSTVGVRGHLGFAGNLDKEAANLAGASGAGNPAPHARL